MPMQTLCQELQCYKLGLPQEKGGGVKETTLIPLDSAYLVICASAE